MSEAPHEAEAYDVAVVGGGILGLSTAYSLLRRYAGVRVAVLEKEDGIARHQTGHNSGVIHSGIYYPPGSLKARLAIEGGGGSRGSVRSMAWRTSAAARFWWRRRRRRCRRWSVCMSGASITG